MHCGQNALARDGVDSIEIRREFLPFTIRAVHEPADLDRALQIRRAAYRRHLPELAESLGSAERYDHDPGSIVLLATSKLDDEPVGTMRIQTNRFDPLWLEQSVILPDWLQGRYLSEATRLGVVRGGIGRLVKIALFKAYYLVCRRAGIDWMVVAGRSPIDQQYEALLFREVFPGYGFMPMRHAGNLPHRVLALDVAQAEPMWRAARHPLYDFVGTIHHPDIRVDVQFESGEMVAQEGQFRDVPERLN